MTEQTVQFRHYVTYVQWRYDMPVLCRFLPSSRIPGFVGGASRGRGVRTQPQARAPSALGRALPILPIYKREIKELTKHRLVAYKKSAYKERRQDLTGERPRGGAGIAHAAVRHMTAPQTKIERHALSILQK